MLVTGIYGAYDVVHEPAAQVLPDGDTIQYVLATDGSVTVPSGTLWHTRVMPPTLLHPRLDAKRPKMMPWCVSDRDVRIADRIVWIDGAYEVTSPTMVADMFAAMAGNPIGQFAHPTRDCIYAELTASYVTGKYDNERMSAQVAHYERAGHPPGWGLWATGVIARDMTNDMFEIGSRWHEECVSWTVQDQLSEPPLLREFGVRPTDLSGAAGGDCWSNRWMHHHGHTRQI